MALVRVAVENGLAVITLDRPPVNAMSRALMGELAAALERVAAGPSARALVVRSALPGMFGAGADIRELAGLDPAGAADFVALGRDVFGLVERLPKPVIAAIEGTCLGGALELAMACDVRIAGRAARLGQPEIDLGTLPGWGGTQRLPRLVGRGRALAMLLTGEPIGADAALGAGLVDQVVGDGAALPAALELADRLALKAPLALAALKESVRRGLGLPLEAGLDEEGRLFAESAATADAREGIAAFLAKRPARFSGR